MGKVFDNLLVVDIMKFCQRYNELEENFVTNNNVSISRNDLHLIVDEMYCLSVYDPDIEYKSVLSINTIDYIQPDLLHVIWGFSKVKVLD